MPKLKIHTYGDEVLRKKTRIIKKFDEKLTALVDDMFELMYQSQGVGLAAPQVGLARRLIVVDTMEAGEKFALSNPKIIWKNDVYDTMCEGCLSIPGVEGDVIRPTAIKVKANDPTTGEEIILNAQGFLARVLQHEIDHLEGVLFIDHLQETERLSVKRALEELVIA
jgi:peptide deformylase